MAENEVKKPQNEATEPIPITYELSIRFLSIYACLGTTTIWMLTY